MVSRQFHVLHVKLIKTAIIGAVVTTSAPGCRSPRTTLPASQPAETSTTTNTGTHDPTQLLADFATHASARQALLGVPFAKVADQFGALQFKAESDFTFSRADGTTYSQTNQALVIHDGLGHVHVRLNTPRAQLEAYVMDQLVYVRKDKGNLRKERRHDTQADTWQDTAFASMHQSLALFEQNSTWRQESTQEKVSGRKAIKFSMRVTPMQNAAQVAEKMPCAPSGTPSASPSATATHWLQCATPQELDGTVWLDAATGIPLQVQLVGTLVMTDPQTTRLQLHYNAHISAIGTAGPVRFDATHAIDDERTPPRAKDPLAFFRTQLPSTPSTPLPEPNQKEVNTPADEATHDN